MWVAVERKNIVCTSVKVKYYGASNCVSNWQMLIVVVVDGEREKLNSNDKGQGKYI